MKNETWTKADTESFENPFGKRPTTSGADESFRTESSAGIPRPAARIIKARKVPLESNLADFARRGTFDAARHGDASIPRPASGDRRSVRRAHSQKGNIVAAGETSRNVPSDFDPTECSTGGAADFSRVWNVAIEPIANQHGRSGAVGAVCRAGPDRRSGSGGQNRRSILREADAGSLKRAREFPSARVVLRFSSLPRKMGKFASP